VQLAEEGHPVVGDKKYGPAKKDDPDPPVKAIRLALHAASLTCTHPFSKEEMTFTAAMPGLFHGFVK
jgi:23S rRNA-/tRNA-specific pseudouridylate synthase